MSAFNDYIRNIMYLVIFMAFVGIIMPGGSYKKYVDIVLGLILIIVIISPVASFFGAETRAEETVKRLFDEGEVAAAAMGGANFTDQRGRMLNDSINEIVSAQLAELLAGTGFTLYDSQVGFIADTARFVDLRLIVERDEAPGVMYEEHETSDSGRPFIRVERVEVSLRQSRAIEAAQANAASSDDEEIRILRRTISDFYNIDPDNIYIEVRMRNR